MNLRNRLLEAGAVVVGLISAATIHYHNHIAVIHNLLPTVGAAVVGCAATLIARGNVSLRLLLGHGVVSLRS